MNCGPGVDKAILDFKDVVEDGSCEVVTRDNPRREDSRVEDRNDGSRREPRSGMLSWPPRAHLVTRG